jgi:ATP-dependent Clp protease ATP-binding subunit ClpC
MTSNLGARIIDKATPMGFQKSSADDIYKQIKESVLNELKKTFNPEFLNRVDETMVFHPLDKEHLHAIIDLLVDETNKKLIDQELVIELDTAVKEWLIEKYYQPTYGARPMRRAIQREIEDGLSEEILKGRFKGINKVRVVLERNAPAFVEVEKPVLTGVN